MPEMVGGCRCGQVRYKASGEPMFVGLCHCKACQKQTGSAFSVVIGLPGTAVEVSGPIKTYDATGDSGKPVHLGFCPNCGSPLVHNADIMPGLTMISAGTLDDPSWVKPAMQIFCDSKQPWVDLGGGMQSFPRMPG